MSTITTRSGKGSPLTNNEVDANFTNLNTDKLESADLAGYATLSGATFTGEVEATGFNGDLTGAILFKGQAGEALTKGDPVYISGISGNKTVVSKADANDANKMPCFGIVDATVSANADCSVVTFGTLQGLDTSSFSEGDELFVSDTGTLTTTAPTGESSQIQKIGKVTRSHASAGSIKVMGAGRTNAVPNLNDGQFFLGNGSNQAVSTDFTTSVLGEISAGTGIGISGSGVISNSAPDQTVSLTGGTGISTSGTYPNFTITNDSPDQTVSLTGAGATSISGTYPNFTITSTDNNTTYTAGTGITLTGTEFSIGQSVATTDSPTFAGLTTTADVSFGDSDKAIFGADSDLQIYHDGSNSFVRDAGTGNLRLQGTNLFLQNAGGTKNYLGAINSGAVTLYHDNAAKLATTSTGIEVTGQVITDASQDAWAFKGTTGSSGNHSGLWFSGEQARLLLRDGTGTIKTMLAANGTDAQNVINGNTIWHAGNDGSGSGLDADTVDGVHASAIMQEFGSTTADLDTLTASGAYRIQNSNANRPADWGQMLTVHGGLDTIGQIYFDYSDGNIKTRAGNPSDVGGSGSWSAWRTVWTDENDGSGSGLDADTLDGQHASAFLGATATAVEASAIDVVDTRNEGARAPNDYGDHQVTAEFTDDINGAWWSSLTVKGWHDGYAPWQLVGYSSTGQNENLYVRFGHGSNNTWSSLRKIWHAGNDGAGSGLDADLLDGLQTKNSSGTTGANQILRSHSNNYFYHGSWIWVQGGGLFANTNNAHFTQNTTTSYGSWKTSGSKGGYDGIVFDSGGDVAIMYDSSGNGGLYRQANGRWHIYHHVGNNCLAIGGSTTSSAYEAYVHGDLYATGNITAYSDARIKENVVTIDSALEKVESMRGVYYNKKDDPDKTKEVGFIAQEVNEVIPEVVTYAEDVDQYGVKYANITALLVESVKELSQQVKDLQAEVKELKENV
jgi:hypothetical protein